jgi:hypothetical protein
MFLKKGYEIPFFLQKGQRPDMVKLNIVFTGVHFTSNQ